MRNVFEVFQDLIPHSTFLVDNWTKGMIFYV